MRQIKISSAITNEETSSVRSYLTEIGRIPLLSPEEEVTLARRVRQGDRAALHRLTATNLRFVVSVAKKYQNLGLPLADLISEGNIGLIKAAECFDDTKGFKFISYAVWWIRQCILTAIAEHTRMIRLPRNQVNTLTKINRFSSELERRLERRPTVEELAEIMEVDIEKITDTWKHVAWTVSYDAPVPETDNCSLVNSLLAGEANIEEQLIAEGGVAAVPSMLAVLSPRERKIIEMTFGIGRDREMGNPEIAGEMNMCTENIRLIRRQAMEKLQFFANATKAELG